MVTLQRLASAKVSGHVTDLTTAFGQARKTKLAESQFDCGSYGLRLCQEPVRHMSFTSFSKRRHLGQVLIDVDDFIEGGKEPHRKAMERFYTNYRCGKSIDLLSVGQACTQYFH